MRIKPVFLTCIENISFKIYLYMNTLNNYDTYIHINKNLINRKKIVLMPEN